MTKLKHLSLAVDEIVSKQCKGCQVKASVGFVLDASGTAVRHYKKMKDLVHYIVEGFKAQRSRLQAMAIRFSGAAYVDIHFGQFSELHSFQVDLDTKMPFIGGRSNIYLGLRAAVKEFKAAKDQSLPKVHVNN